MPKVSPMRGRGADEYAYFTAPFTALAHRGGITEDAPAEVENSLRGFVAAWAFGFTHLETDVHVTSDGTLVAFHDEVLDRVTDASGHLADLPWAEVSRARIGGSEPIPTLAELLDALPQARFNIDLKAPGAIEPLVATLEQHGALDRVCVGSFHRASIAAFRRLTGGRVATSASPVEVGCSPGPRRPGPAGRWRAGVPDAHPRTAYAPAPGDPRHDRGARTRRGAVVHVWTINDRPDMERLIELGVDGIVTDDLATLKAVLVERGLWEDTMTRLAARRGLRPGRQPRRQPAQGLGVGDVGLGHSAPQHRHHHLRLQRLHHGQGLRPRERHRPGAGRSPPASRG